MDLDPFVPVGINTDTMRMLDVFLLHCLGSASPPDSPEENVALANNQHLTAARGREPGLMLERDGRAIALTDWAAEILAECRPIAAALDAALGGDLHRAALVRAQATLNAPHQLSSARVLDAMARDFNQSYTRFIRAQAESSKRQLIELPYTAELQAQFEAMSRDSVAAQRRIEAEPSVPFEAWRLAYLAPERLGL